MADINMTDWYNNFINGSSQATHDSGTQISLANTEKRNPLGDLLVYTMQTQANLMFIQNILSSIESDVRRDIMDDINPCCDMQPNYDPGAPVVSKLEPPLKKAVDNKDGLINASKNVSELLTSIKSILDRVRIKEN